jgi:CheY-like chemotaxis protein
MFSLDEDETNLHELISNVVELLANRAHAKDIEIVSVTSSDLPRTVRADGPRLRQILTNLVGNAVKFTEKGGVHVGVGLEEGRDRRFIRFEVRDTGVGVPEEKRKEIFEEFVQADSTHARKFGGTGLGLAISKRLVELMGGSIGVDPVPGGGSGSLFWFRVPAIVVEGPAEDGVNALFGATIAVSTRNAVLREALSEQVQAAGGKVASHNANEQDRPDLMLIDAGTDGETRDPPAPEHGVPALILVTAAARMRLGDIASHGYSGYLIKPVRQSSLVQQIALHLRAAEQESYDYDSAPVAPMHMLEPVMQAPVQSMPHGNSENGEGLRILLAEDNPINALLTRELLRKRGYRVVEVTTGDAAVKIMAEETFDLLLTDIHMPGMDGIEATRAIRAWEAEQFRPRTPIVALTADALETGKRACLEAGMDGFLTKPVHPSELDEMLLTLFPAAAPPPPMEEDTRAA